MKRICKKPSTLLHAMKGFGKNIKDYFSYIFLPCTNEAFIIGGIIYSCVAGAIVTAIIELLKYLLGR